MGPSRRPACPPYEPGLPALRLQRHRRLLGPCFSAPTCNAPSRWPTSPPTFVSLPCDTGTSLRSAHSLCPLSPPAPPPLHSPSSASIRTTPPLLAAAAGVLRASSHPYATSGPSSSTIVAQAHRPLASHSPQRHSLSDPSIARRHAPGRRLDPPRLQQIGVAHAAKKRQLIKVAGVAYMSQCQ